VYVEDAMTSNEVRSFDTPQGVARLRIQVYGDYISLRAEPAKGDNDEQCSLELIGTISQRARDMDILDRVFSRRHREGRRVTDYVDIIDAVDLRKVGRTEELIRQLVR
jgi:hypothetical protein